MQITTIGLDLAKHWFQIHGVDAAGKLVVKRRLRRAEVIGFCDARQKAREGRRARQQDRADRLGGDETRRSLSAKGEIRRARGLKRPSDPATLRG